MSAAETPTPEIIDAVKLFLKSAADAVKETEEEEAKNKSQIPDMAGKIHSILEQRRNSARRRARKLNPPKDGPTDGEEMNELTLDVRMIPLSKIFYDPDFNYVRVNEDPQHPELYGNQGHHLTDLEESMREEGLKDPIEVQVKGDEYMLRAGTRRWKVAKKLGWKEIPATVIPDFIPVEWQYWSAVARNTARKSLGTYEVALSAKVARDQYNTPPPEFARKMGYTPGYVYNLLRCLDNLPDHLINQWRDGARVTLDQWISLSHLDHLDAIKLYRRWTGQTPIDRLRQADKNARRKPLPPARWVDRMMRLYVGVEGSDLSPRERDNVLHAIEHCMGTRDGIPGVYEPKKHAQYAKKKELRNQLKLPDVPSPGEEKEMPPPMDEDGDEQPNAPMRMTTGNWRSPERMNTSSTVESHFDRQRAKEKRRRKKRELELVRDS